MARLLVVHHSPTPTTLALAEAVIAGSGDEAISGVEVVVRPALEASAEDVLAADGTTVGHTTSGTFSPTLGHSIALALLDSASGVDDGDEVLVDVRGRRLRARVTKPPFVPSHVR